MNFSHSMNYKKAPLQAGLWRLYRLAGQVRYNGRHMNNNAPVGSGRHAHGHRRACPVFLLLFLAAASCTTKPQDFRSWAQTPPMGWNSWDCYGPTVTEQEVKVNADYMATFLKPYGWEYVVVDIRWFVENDKAGGYNQTDPRYVLDAYGRYQPAVNRFPSAANERGFKDLARYVHDKGLKFGIHIMRGIPKVAVENKMPIKGAPGVTADMIYSPEGQCQWLRDNYTIVADRPGAQAYYNSLFDMYARWGVDFVKIDDIARPYHQEEIALIRQAIDQCGRPIVLSLSPGETPIAAAEHVRTHANMWRMVDDVWDTWPHLAHLIEVAQQWIPYSAPGTWPDCDMIPLGRISIRGERGADRRTRLTPDEQQSLMTFFCIMRSPLMFGGDLPSNDDFTLSLLTNADVLEMHRNSDQVRLLQYNPEGITSFASRHAPTGDMYATLLNLSAEPQPYTLPLAALSDRTVKTVTNLWTGTRTTSLDGVSQGVLEPHACLLVQVSYGREEEAGVK